MSTPFLGQVQAFGFGLIPRGWLPCNGQLLSVVQNQALFSLLGTTYGGDGTNTFALPNLQGLFSLSTGTGYSLGQRTGEASHTLLGNEMPPHIHPVVASSANAVPLSPSGAFPGVTAGTYSASANALLGTGSSQGGGSQPHNNMPPYLTVNVCIATQGIYPSRN